MIIYLLYLFTGVLAGLLAGLLGVGGGIIVVPILSLLLTQQHFPPTLIMHIAIGTSLAIMIFTALSSALAYYRKKLIVWPLFFKFIPGLLFGTLIGSLMTRYVTNETLQIAFAIFMLLIACHLLTYKEPKTKRDLPNFFIVNFIAFFIGIFSGFFGIGGGSMIVPFFIFCQIEMHKATGTSSLCGVPLAILGTLSLMVTGWHETSGTPPGTIGFVYWPAAFLIATTSVIFAPVGTRLAIWLSGDLLKRIFAALLVFTAINLLMR